MNDTQSKIEATVTYLLGLIWQQGEALRAATPRDAGKHAGNIRTLAQSVNQLQWVNYDSTGARNQPDQPQPEPQDAPEEDAPDEEAQEQE